MIFLFYLKTILQLIQDLQENFKAYGSTYLILQPLREQRGESKSVMKSMKEEYKKKNYLPQSNTRNYQAHEYKVQGSRFTGEGL